MRSLLARPFGRVSVSLFSGRRARRLAVPLLALCAAGGLASAGGATESEYSAYADPEKPVISFLLSEEKNVEDLRTEFDLDDGEVGRVLAVARAEKETLEGEYAESERIVAANGGLPPEEIGEKISASDYEEETEAAIAETKSEIEALLPEDRAADFGGWVDEQWAQEQEEFRAGARAGSSGGKVCRTIYASWYRSATRNGNNYEVALPHQKVKFAGGYRVRVRHNGRGASIPVKEVGPWNIKDNYWARPRDRTKFRNLPRCKPEAEAAFFDNYNRGEDQFGREVANPAGIDLTLSAAAKMGVKKKLRRNGIIKVDVRFPWVPR